MSPRSAAALLAMALIAAACSGTSATDLADGDQTVDEATATSPPVGDPDAGDATTSEPSGDGAAADGAVAEEGDDEAAAATVEALWWEATTVADGSSFAAADLAGRDVVLWMWAPWCSVCNREAPEIAEALADLPDDVTIVGVAGRDDVGPMQDFVAEHGLEGMTHVVDADGAVWASYGISYQPAWVFIDADGTTAVAAGALGYDGLLAGIVEVFGG